MNKLRQFTRNDWAYLAGAERFAGGAEPLVAEVGDALIVADGDGAEILWQNDGDPRRVAFSWPQEAAWNARPRLFALDLLAALVGTETGSQAETGR